MWACESWDKGLEFHNLTSLLGTDCSFTHMYSSSVCKGPEDYLWKTVVQRANYTIINYTIID